MELQTCLLFSTLVVCGADIRPAGWLDKVVAHWKKSFVDDFEQLGPNFNLDASIELTPPGYKDSPDWDFDSVSRMLALLSVSEKGQPALKSLRRMIAPTRRMMMDVPGLGIPQSLYSNRKRKIHRSGMNQQRGMSYYRKRTDNNRMGRNNQMGMANNRKGMANNRMGMANNRKGMANNRKGMANNRKGMANNRKGMANNRMGMDKNRMAMAFYERMGMKGKTGRKQMIEKRLKEERDLSDFQMSFRLFPSIKDRFLNDIYYDGERDDYEDASPEYEYVDPLAAKRPEDAVVLLKNPVEARLPSARISVKLLKEILEARAQAARLMPTKKTTRYDWKPTDSTLLNNGTTDENSTAAEGAATGAEDGGATTDGNGDEATTPGGGGGEAKTEAGGGGDDAPVTEEPPPPPPEEEGRKMAAKSNKVADNTIKVADNTIKVADNTIKVADNTIKVAAKVQLSS